MKRKLNSFIECSAKLSFGTYLLFQEYQQQRYNTERKEYDYAVSSPILAIYIGWAAFDQTIGFYYLPWHHDRLESKSQEICMHIEWNDYIDILWDRKPTWREIIKVWRSYNPKGIVQSNEIDWEY